MKQNNFRKKSTTALKQKGLYVSKRKKEDYEAEDDQSDQDEYEQDLQDLKYKLHSINYNYYTEALKLMLYEKSRPLMPLKLGPVISRPNVQGLATQNQNGQSSYVAQFNQGNIQQYNSQMPQPNYLNAQGQRSPKLTYNQSSPQLQLQQYDSLSTPQSRQRFPQEQIYQQDFRLPPINQQNNYQRSRFAEQLPIIASPISSQMGISYQQQTQIDQINPADLNDTTYQNQRLMQLGTPNNNIQESVQYINGKRYKVRQMQVSSPTHIQYGADQYTSQIQKRKKQNKNQYDDSFGGYARNQRNYEDVGLNDTGSQKMNKKEMLKNRKSQRNLDSQTREDKKSRGRSQKQLYDDNSNEDEQQEEDKMRRKKYQRQNTFKEQENQDQDNENNNQRKSKYQRQNTFTENNEDEEQTKQSVRSRGRSKSRKQSMKSKSRANMNNDDIGDDNQDEEENTQIRKRRNKSKIIRNEDLDDNDEQENTNTRKKRNKSKIIRNEDLNDNDEQENTNTRKRRNKSKIIRNEDIDDDGLDEFKPKKSQRNIVDDNDYQESRSTTKLRKKTYLKKRDNDDDNDGQSQADLAERSQRRKATQRKKTIAQRRADDDGDGQDDDQPNKNERKKTFVSSKKKKTIIMTQNQINSLGYLNEEEF